MNFPFSSASQIVIGTVARDIALRGQPSFKQRLAATELQRGLYQLGYPGCIHLTEGLGSSPGEQGLDIRLISHQQQGETYTIRSEESTGEARRLILEGASDQALLYAVFDFLERQGAFFGIDGDSYPLTPEDGLVLPPVDHPWEGQPQFAVRGLLPWPDFLNCISVYNREDWRAYLEAMLRMRFNTLGIHVYAQENKWVESFLAFEYGGVGHAAFTDTTATNRWGYLPQRTSRYGLSAAQYFDGEVFGADATRLARDPWEAAQLAQTLWQEAFAYAEALGIRTGVGFEPYRVPEEIYQACPPEARTVDTYEGLGQSRAIQRIDPESRTARYILETRLANLLETYPSVSHVYLWEDEFMNWASQQSNVELPVTPFLQAHDFLRRHAPDKRLVLAGWGGVVRHFDHFHRSLPDDVIFTALSDQFGWDPVHEAFGQLGDRERWPIPWLEDDPAMWFPQFHVNRFARDIQRAEEFDCQGMLGIHWRHRIVDPNAAYMARRFWDKDLTSGSYYGDYASVQATGERATELAELLAKVDQDQPLLSTWTGAWREDGHAETQEFAGDYSEAFRIENGREIRQETLAAQAEVIEQFGELARRAASPLEAERLGYLHGQVGFLDPYGRAWQCGVALHKLLEKQREHRRAGDAAGAQAVVSKEGVPLWIELLGHVRSAVLAFQHTVATRNDLGMLASIHNKFVRIATFRLRMSLLEFLDELPPEAETACQEALDPDVGRSGEVIVPTRPTRLAPGESVTITAIAPGVYEPVRVVLQSRRLGTDAWHTQLMARQARRTFATRLTMPAEVDTGIEYRIAATFAASPTPLVVTAPPAGAPCAYVVTR